MLYVFLSNAQAATYYKLSSGQVVYVPVYSDVFSSPNKFPSKLAVMLSIRNTDTMNTIMAPPGSIHVYIPADDRSGGEGANFIVRWTATGEVNIPIVESIMIGRDLSIVSPGQEIREQGK